MKGDENTSPDEQFLLWLAACDEALAAGAEPSLLYETVLHGELLSRLEREVAWCQKVRELWPHGEPGGTEDENPTVPESGGEVPSIVGTQLGRFQIRRELGRGTFGVVFLAYDPQLGREVALKVPRAEALLTPELRTRFQQEARTAAALEHPNLVPVYEAGQEGDICYIAAAYCPGVTLAEWLRQRTEPVPPQPAARLLQTLATAVEHAHQHGVVHRDLKPGNVLLQKSAVRGQKSAVRGQQSEGPRPDADCCPLTADLCPKITDFGLAKLIEGAAEGNGSEFVTGTGAILGTANYMAPEQAEGQSRHVGPGADIYALGVILYEVLTGRPPFTGENLLATLQLVRGQEPVSPARLRPGLPRDLETICLKCLEKTPARRYPTAHALADDLQRFLAGEPIRARPVSAWERLRKWTQRRPALAALIAVSTTAMLVVTAQMIVSDLRVRQQRNLAEVRRQEADQQRNLAEVRRQEAEMQRKRALAHLRSARDAVDRMLTRVADGLAPAPYTLIVRRQLLEDALQLYQDLDRQEEGDPDIQFEVGRAWRRRGKIQETLGQRQEAAESFRQAVTLFEQLSAEAPNRPEYRQELAASCNNLSGSLDGKQRAQREQLLQRALSMQDQLVAEYPETLGYLLDASVTRGDLAILFQTTGRPDDALRISAEGIEGLEKLVAAEPASTEYRGQLALYLNNRGAFLGRGGRYKEAEPVFRRVVALYETLVTGPGADPRNRLLLALSNHNLGMLLVEHGAPDEGEKHLRRAAAVRRELTRDYPQVSAYHAGLGTTLDKLAFALRARGEAAEALGCWEEALTHQRLVVEADPDDVAARQTLGGRYWNVADGRLQLGQYREAAKAAAEMPALLPDHSLGNYQAARIHTRCVILAAQDAKLSPAEKEVQARAYADRAIQFLASAVQKGDLKGAALAKDNNFGPLRSLPAFQRLVSDAERKP